MRGSSSKLESTQKHCRRQWTWLKGLTCGGNRQLVVGKKGVRKKSLKNNRKRDGAVIEGRDLGALVLLEDQLVTLRENRLYPLLQAPRESLGVGQQEGTRAKARGGR